MNVVGKIALFFSGKDPLFFRGIYADWENNWTVSLEKSTDRILKKYDDGAFVLELDTLELKLESISPENFKQNFIPAYEEALENALQSCIYGQRTLRTKKTPAQKSRTQLLFHFLLHGTLEWKTAGIKDLNELFLEVAQKETNVLRSFLRTYGHYTSLQQRLVLQFDEDVLKKGVHVVAKGESHFIVSYVTLVQKHYEKLRSQKISVTPYRQVVWKVIYAYLLTNRSSFFNKKSFLKQTIRDLANRFRITYQELFHLLLMNEREAYPIELLELLGVLKKEHELGIHREDDWKTWIKLSLFAEQASPEQLTGERALLLKLLKSNNNYLFLRSLRESQILKLVETVVPQQYSFVKTYATELDQHKKQGMLQGKAGNEFRLVKWQVLFPVLLENNGLGFNRLHFVEQVLRKVAAHYNLRFLELLNYFRDETAISQMDRELGEIFRELYHLSQNAIRKPRTIEVTNAGVIVRQLQQKKDISEEEISNWFVYLRNETNRNGFLHQLSENEHCQLIQVLYRKESRFILAYTAVISQQHNHGALQGKTSGDFKTLQWQFIHTVLLESHRQVFNKRYFVENVIRKIAAHYNLKTEELTAFFYTETKKNRFTVPFDLIKILGEIHQEYQQKVQQKEQPNSGEIKPELYKITDTEQFLIRHFGKEEHLYFLIRRLAQTTSFIRFIEPVLHIESVLRQFIFRRLAVSIDKKQLLLLLLRISMSHTHLNKADMLQKILVFFFSQLKEKEQQQLFSEQLEKTAETNSLLKKSMELNTEQEETIIVGKEQEEELIPEDEQQPLSFIGNAGLILLTPFLPRLFTLLKLTENGTFKDRDAQIKAIFLMQYAVFGMVEFPEYELQLNKLLTGVKTGIPLPRSVTLTEHEKKTTDEMLQGILKHWNKVKTIDGLRDGFLQRDGKLEKKDEVIELTIEGKAFDMLLDAVPWNFRTIKFSWMEKTIQVKWR